MKNYIKKIISLQITTSLFLQQTLIANNLAVDTTAPKNNQANIEKARNGVPVVNIVAPTQSGLSHNKFSDYNVNKDGLILNNSNKQEVNTQLAGYIYGNKNLRNGTAKTILNEVTSKNRTYLKGFTEVAGDRASVVVANPNGIYINGAGFINTYKATITTGNPNIINHELRGFDIKTGQIDIDGSGLNVSNVNKAELYAKTISLNAKIYAQNLDVVTGENKILQDGTIKNIEDVVKEKPLLSLDSSSLGGIYANKISLIGTQKGVGVNLPIEIIAQDSLVLSVDGKIFLDKVSSEKDVEIASKNDSINTNIVYANSINMEAKNDITNEELIIAQNSISLKANDIVNKNAIATLNKDIDITAKNLTNYNTIYSNDSVNLYLEDTLLNSTNSSVVDLANEKATIEAKNSISIKANRVVNDKAIIKTQNEDINIEAFSLENLAGNPNIKGSYIQSGNSKSIQNGTRINTQTIARDRAGNTYNAFTIYTDVMSYDKNYIYSSIISGNDMNIISNNIKNNYSLIFAQNNINIEANTLANISTDIVKLVTTHKDIYQNERYCKHKVLGKCVDHSNRSAYRGRQTTYNVEVIDSVNSTIQAGGKIFANLDKLENGMLENKTLEFDTYNSFNSSLFKNIPLNKDEEGNYKLPTNRYSLFTTTNPNKNPEYLVESNPLYTNYDNYIGSSYFFDKVGYSQDRKIKRLGDAAYETKLVSDAIFRLTGQRSLNLDFQNENQQFVVLMENAVNLSGILELELGKPLSKEQINNLTEDIVWMEEKIVNGQIVLVPVVYLAKDYKTKGASIVANNIDLDIKDGLNSSGTIKSNKDMNIDANSITNSSGVLLSKGKATLISNEDFINKNGGQIKGDEIAIASINGSVINETYSNTYTEDSILNKKSLFGTKQVKNGNFTNTQIGKTSSIEANNLLIFASQDITNSGANLKAEETLQLQTQSGDINLNAIKKESGYNLNFSGGFDKSKDVEYQTSNIEANNILMQSGNNINLQATKLKAKEDINLSASNDVNVEALNNEYYRDRQTTTKGFMSKKTTRDMVQRLGGIDDIQKSFAHQKINNNNIKNIKVEAPNHGIIIYPTSILNLYEQLINDHSNLDSKDVWKQFNEK
ncbi:hypothetical protein CRU94_08470 [Arcobacter sp. AHV-9/2010]|uniref:filamentous hemagglutinin N-terminal domain-containing protein n=1 Tax=Arcobacter sp. AHV-9/2010 TaxID=2021861 RepID=UPI00100BBFEE|nr:filamentous hemagglutinin N-terminal domain-containing protein [Arcobacter sp. CECT 9299]RXJ94478.1 hypothetical protein CRU94_08470 [Arcobacter sp. CECT 9299]